MLDKKQDYIDFFKTLQQQNTLTPCWILKGDKGIGKADFAKHLAKEILYKSDIQNHGMPNSLIDKQIENDAYPNFLYLTRQILDDGTFSRDINAENARKVKTFLQKKPAVSGWRVVIIDALDDLNRFAANSLLKVLEEPPSKTLILLIAHQLGDVLPTIRSRCKVLTLLGTVHAKSDDYTKLENVLIKTMNDFMQGQNASLDGFFKNIIDDDKTLKTYQYMILLNLHNWLTKKNTAPVFFNKYSTAHWVSVYQALNQFFNALDAAHLDATQSLVTSFALIKKPDLYDFSNIMNSPFA